MKFIPNGASLGVIKEILQKILEAYPLSADDVSELSEHTQKFFEPEPDAIAEKDEDNLPDWIVPTLGTEKHTTTFMLENYGEQAYQTTDILLKFRCDRKPRRAQNCKVHGYDKKTHTLLLDPLFDGGEISKSETEKIIIVFSRAPTISFLGIQTIQ